MKRMGHAHPEMVRLWDLASRITERAFGSADPFQDGTEEDDLALQRAAEKFVPELVGGRYDAGLTAAAGLRGETSSHPSFRSLLDSYRGPVSPAKGRAGLVPRLLNAEAYHFERFVLPNYPPLALSARIEGKVEFQLTMDPATGEVSNVIVISGHSLLHPSVSEAAKQWRFVPNSANSWIMRLTLDFAIRCP